MDVTFEAECFVVYWPRLKDDQIVSEPVYIYDKEEYDEHYLRNSCIPSARGWVYNCPHCGAEVEDCSFIGVSMLVQHLADDHADLYEIAPYPTDFAEIIGRYMFCDPRLVTKKGEDVSVRASKPW